MMSNTTSTAPVQSLVRRPFALDQIDYPAFVVVSGRSRSSITMYNRSEYPEHFACDVCQSADDAARLLDGYGGRVDDLDVYAVPSPMKVLRVNRDSAYADYDATPDVEE